MDFKVRKLITIDNAIYARDDIDRLYEREGRRGPAIIEDSVNASPQRLVDFIKKNKERLITAK